MKLRRPVARFAFALGLVLACGAAAPATAPPSAPASNGLSTPDYRIETSETHWNFNTGDFTMPHRVRFFRPGTDAVGDKANGNSKQGTATLIGSVVVHDSGNATEAGDAAYRGSGPATLTCDKLDIDSKAKLYTATGNVHFSQGARTGTADHGVLNRATGMLHLDGSVHLSDNGSTLSADSVDYNINTKDADVHGNPAAMTQPANRPAPPAPAVSASPGAAPSSAPKKSLPSLETPYYKLETDDISRKANGDFTMPHKVTFSRPGSDGTADRAEGNDKRSTITLIGNVVIHDNGNAPEADSNDDYAKGGPSTLTCDRLDVDSKAKIYNAIGHVHFEQGARKADAERGVLNRGTGMLHLQGNVKTSEGGSSMRADEMDYNLTTKHMESTGKPILIKQPVPTPAPGSASPTPAPKKKRRLPIPI